MEKRTAVSVFDKIKSVVEAKIPVKREVWLDLAFDLVVLRLDEARAYNMMRQGVAKAKVALYETQEKKNVAAVDMAIEASDEYKFMHDQEDFLYSIDELIRVAKKNADVNF